MGGSTTPLSGESFGRDQLVSAFGRDVVVDGPRKNLRVKMHHVFRKIAGCFL